MWELVGDTGDERMYFSHSNTIKEMLSVENSLYHCIFSNKLQKKNLFSKVTYCWHRRVTALSL